MYRLMKIEKMKKERMESTSYHDERTRCCALYQEKVRDICMGIYIYICYFWGFPQAWAITECILLSSSVLARMVLGKRERRSCPKAILFLLPVHRSVSFSLNYSWRCSSIDEDDRDSMSWMWMFYRMNRNQWLEKETKNNKERRRMDGWMDCQMINIDEDSDEVECFFFVGHVESMASENTRIDECTLCRITICIDLGR